MAIPNLFWRNVEVVSAPLPLYLNFYRKLAMTAKPSVERVADRYGNCYLWLRRAIPGNLLTVIDRRNICAAEQIWYGQRSGSVKGLATPNYFSRAALTLLRVTVFMTKLLPV